MTEFTKGGRGKAAPYGTTHHRIPEPCKETVKTICDTWKRLLGDDEDGEGKAQKLLTDIENVTVMHYMQEFEEPVNGYIYKLATDVETTHPDSEELEPTALTIDRAELSDAVNKFNEKKPVKSKIKVDDVRAILKLMGVEV